MSVSVTMPRLGESVTEGTVTRWLKSEGEQIEVDEPLLEVSTDKVDTEIPAPAGGTLSAIKVGEDETVEVGEELAVIDDAAAGGAATSAGQAAPAEAAPAEAAPAETASPAPAQAPPAEAPPASAQPAARQEQPERQAQANPQPPAARQEATAARAPYESQPGQAQHAAQPTAPPAPARPEGDTLPYVTPLVRKLATEHDVDLNAVEGTGVGGRIRKQDVLDAARQRPSAQTPTQPVARAPEASTPAPARTAPGQSPAPVQSPAAGQPGGPAQRTPTPSPVGARGTTEKMSRLRSVIAERMVESLQVSAQLTTVVEVDVTAIARLREQAKVAFEQREGVKLSFLPFFAVATVEALKEHPAMNSSLDTERGEITYHDSANLGIAVDTERGLLVPVIADAQDLNLSGFARKVADLAERTRASRVTPDELGGGTFTLTNTGSRGALFDTPIINQPQVGILGTGTVVKRPVVVDDPDLGEVIAVRSMIYLALTYDHRVVDGADATRFLTAVATRLEEGAFESELGL